MSVLCQSDPLLPFDLRKGPGWHRRRRARCGRRQGAGNPTVSTDLSLSRLADPCSRAQWWAGGGTFRLLKTVLNPDIQNLLISYMFLSRISSCVYR